MLVLCILLPRNTNTAFRSVSNLIPSIKKKQNAYSFQNKFQSIASRSVPDLFSKALGIEKSLHSLLSLLIHRCIRELPYVGEGCVTIGAINLYAKIFFKDLKK